MVIKDSKDPKDSTEFLDDLLHSKILLYSMMFSMSCHCADLVIGLVIVGLGHWSCHVCHWSYHWSCHCHWSF